MKNVIITSLLSLALFGCAQTKKTEMQDSEPEMKKIQEEDIVDAMTKKMDKKNFNEAKQKPAPSSAALPASQSIITCSAGSDVRVLEIKPIDEKGCELQYTKNGDTKTVANANFNVSYCETVQNRIFKKLESAGFDCQ